MAQTQTQTIQKQVNVNAHRTHDYLYDPVHAVSSERDHARATFQAHTSMDRVKRVPIYRAMFSELRHHPRFAVRLENRDPVPQFVNRQWQGVTQTSELHPIADVTGRNRALYQRRPIIPFMQQVPPDVVLAAARQETLLGGAGAQQRPRTPLSRSVHTQTDYRDSEAQTDPYTPEYVVRPGEQPELLTLATLSWQRGLPAGMAEVEMIERARAKRAWEATLPPLSDTSQLDKRRKMMDEMERKEWELREQEIEKLQEARLDILLKLLKQREDNHQELNSKRLDRLWSRKQKEKEERFKRIRYEHIKCIRKLIKKRQNVEGKLVRRDIVQDYANNGSQSFAPLTRIGVFLDRGSEQYVVKSRYLQSYEGLLELENTLPTYVLQPRVRAPKPKTVTGAGFVKRKYRREQELAEFHQYIKDQKKEAELAEKKPLRFLQKIERPIPRPSTPKVAVPPEEQENKELAVIFMQQLIRGRAIQSMMYEGKEKRRELIRELRSTHALQEAEQLQKRQEKAATLSLQRQRRLHQHREWVVDGSMAQVEGETLGNLADYLSKELVRLQEERRIHAFTMLAERQRRIREAEESGLRQVEERRRREEDEVFKQVVKVQQDCVDTYLEEIIAESMDRTADDVARVEIRNLAETLNNIAYDAATRRTDLDSEEMVADLVHQFVIPEVQKQTIREKVRREQRKHLVAAHREIFIKSDTIIEAGNAKAESRSSSRQSKVSDAATSTPAASEERAPSPPKEEKDRAPSPPKDERAPSPPKEERAPSPPKGEEARAPSPPKEERAPSPPKEARAPSPPKEEEDRAPSPPKEEEDRAPSSPKEEDDRAPSPPKEDRVATPPNKEERTLSPSAKDDVIQPPDDSPTQVDDEQ